MTVASAPGKVILFGEHAVVYGRPAIAVPVTEVEARVIVEDAPTGQGITIVARDLNLIQRGVDAIPPETPAYPLATTIRNVLRYLGLSINLDLTVTISSTIPIGRGLGSGAAVATALVRALSTHLGKDLSDEQVSELVYRTEVIHHGTPSGIDNSVVVFGKPIYFVKGHPIQYFRVGRPFRLIIADTGVISSTREVVSDVRRAWKENPKRYEALFDRVGQIATQGRRSIEEGRIGDLGRLMSENHRLLQEIGVSSPELDALIRAALRAGAKGAKLCGAGRGGNMIALVTPEVEEAVCKALWDAGAVGIIGTWVM